MNPKYILKLLFIIITLSSCTEKIELDVPSSEEQIVVNSVMKPNEKIMVNLTHTTKMLDTSRGFINEANIQLWQNNNLVETLKNDSTSFYSSQHIAQTDSEYKIVVETSKYKQTQAVCKIPKPVEIADGYIKYKAYYNTGTSTDLNEIGITFNDPIDEENYYEVIFYVVEEWSDGIHKKIQNELTSNNFIIKDENYIDYIDKYNSTSLVFSDKNITNPCEIVFYCGQASYKSVNYDGTIYHYEYNPLYAVLRSVSYDYYKYQISWLKHLYNKDMINIDEITDLTNLVFTGNPFDMYTNITNGLGIFAAYSESSFELRTPEK